MVRGVFADTTSGFEISSVLLSSTTSISSDTGAPFEAENVDSSVTSGSGDLDGLYDSRISINRFTLGDTKLYTCSCSVNCEKWFSKIVLKFWQKLIRMNTIKCIVLFQKKLINSERGNWKSNSNYYIWRLLSQTQFCPLIHNAQVKVRLYCTVIFVRWSDKYTKSFIYNRSNLEIDSSAYLIFSIKDETTHKRRKCLS